MTKQNVLLIGTGGVGAVVAYGIDFSGKSNLSVVVRSDYEKVKEVGWEFESVDYGSFKGWKPDDVYPNIGAAATAKQYDFVVVTTKNLPDIIKIEELIEPVIIIGKTTIVLVQNGFDLGRPIVAKYPENVCVSCITYIGSHNYNGRIIHTQTDKTTVSYYPNKNLSLEAQEEKAKEFLSIYSNEKNNIIFSPDEKYTRYTKLVYNATLNTICALTRIDTGRMDIYGGIDSIALPAMREVVAVAKADGVILHKDAINNNIHSDDGDWFKPSMLVDVEAGNPFELEVILGNLLTVAKELKVETPILSLIYQLLKGLQFKFKEERGYIKVNPEREISTRYFS